MRWTRALHPSESNKISEYVAIFSILKPRNGKINMPIGQELLLLMFWCLMCLLSSPMTLAGHCLTHCEDSWPMRNLLKMILKTETDAPKCAKAKQVLEVVETQGGVMPI